MWIGQFDVGVYFSVALFSCEKTANTARTTLRGGTNETAEIQNDWSVGNNACKTSNQHCYLDTQYKFQVGKP